MLAIFSQWHKPWETELNLHSMSCSLLLWDLCQWRLLTPSMLPIFFFTALPVYRPKSIWKPNWECVDDIPSPWGHSWDASLWSNSKERVMDMCLLYRPGASTGARVVAKTIIFGQKWTRLSASPLSLPSIYPTRVVSCVTFKTPSGEGKTQTRHHQ